MTHRLPITAYTSNDWFDREQNGIFSKNWQFFGLRSDFSKPGDFKTGQIGSYPIMIICDEKGKLSAFHNVCRHRGTTLLEGSGKIGRSIVCPYHRWTYALDGRLKGIPNATECFPDLERGKLSLKPAAIGFAKDLVFVNPDSGSDFSAFIDPINKLLWPHDLGAKDVKEGQSLTYEINCNWKVFVENAIDGYHLSYLHEQTLGGPSADQNVWEQYSDHMIWYAMDEPGKRHSLPKKSRKEAEAMWAVPIKATQGSEFGGVYFLFPNTLIAATPYSFSVSTVIPVKADQCLLQVRQFVGPWQSKNTSKYIPGYDRTTGVISSKNWKKHPLETGDFQTEDVWICEKVQKGMGSPSYEAGPLSAGTGAEDPIKWFHGSLFNNMPW